MFAIFQPLVQNVSMKQINALTLHKLTASDFTELLEMHEMLELTFFNQVIGYIEKPADQESVLEISLPDLCRKSKRLLQYELLALGGKMKVVSGQHSKQTVAYMVAK